MRKRSQSDEQNLSISITEAGISLRESAVDIPKKMGNCISLTQDEAVQLYTLLYKILES